MDYESTFFPHTEKALGIFTPTALNITTISKFLRERTENKMYEARFDASLPLIEPLQSYDLPGQTIRMYNLNTNSFKIRPEKKPEELDWSMVRLGPASSATKFYTPSAREVAQKEAFKKDANAHPLPLKFVDAGGDEAIRCIFCHILDQYDWIDNQWKGLIRLDAQDEGLLVVVDSPEPTTIKVWGCLGAFY